MHSIKKSATIAQSNSHNKALPSLHEFEYVVNLNKGVDYLAFWKAMADNRSNVPGIPARSVSVINERQAVQRSKHYALTAKEATALAAHPSVHSVAIPPYHNTQLAIDTKAIRYNNFDKPTDYSSLGNNVNWGLARASADNNIYGQNYTTPESVGYTLNGSGVDVVIQDTGIEPRHPEFAGEFGNPRVSEINWYEASGLTSYTTVGSINTSGSPNGLDFSPGVAVGGSTDDGSTPFTVEFWFNLDLAPSSYQHAFIGSNQDAGMSIYTGTDFSGLIPQTNGITVDWYNYGGVNFLFAAPILAGTWYHCAVVRDSNSNLQMFLNGQSPTSYEIDITTSGPGYSSRNISGSGYITGYTAHISGVTNSISHWGIENLYLAGFITNLRMITGTAIYDPTASTITVPTSPLTDVAGTKLLLNVFNSASALTDTSGINTLSITGNVYFSIATPGLQTLNTQSSNFYRDFAGHGTHVAGIIAGKNYGWATNANIYSVKVQGLEGTDDSNTGLPFPDCFDVIIGWHNNKEVDPDTGYKRPTVVNMSWGYSYAWSDINIVGGVFERSTSWSGEGAHPEYGMGLEGTAPARDPSTDVAIEEMIAAGIHVCIAAGNDSIKIDVPGGIDYNNYALDNNGYAYYYQQGGSPYSPNAIIVGSVDVNTYNSTLDRKADYSNAGPGVDIYTPGTAITSATSNVNDLPNDGYVAAAYFNNSDWKQATLAGTSMASPQIAGIAAVFLSINPHATPLQLKQWLLFNATNTIYTTGSSTDYESSISLWGGNANMAYNRFNSITSSSIGG